VSTKEHIMSFLADRHGKKEIKTQKNLGKVGNAF
jgi:hypothetical protein